LPGSKKVPSSRKSQDEDRKDDESAGSKFNTESVRSHAQKALKQVLHTRSQLVPEEERASDEVILKLSKDIELKLYNLHNQETNQKYRVKCRSLLFNLKDTKNEKILCGELSTKQLVRMSPEQLASRELAEWREKTIKKELEMIQEVAKEELQMSSVVRKMTYKGEVEIERDDVSPLATELSMSFSYRRFLYLM
uniref:TFIIS central domain-containing protein n=1 Tax=Amphimedon queenslandica TaxID=400682 RepID=A0A1X7SHW4_AMPQE